MLIMNIICMIVGFALAIFGLIGGIVVISEKRDHGEFALVFASVLLSVICFYAAYMGGVAW